MFVRSDLSPNDMLILCRELEEVIEQDIVYSFFRHLNNEQLVLYKTKGPFNDTVQDGYSMQHINDPNVELLQDIADSFSYFQNFSLSLADHIPFEAELTFPQVIIYKFLDISISTVPLNINFSNTFLSIFSLAFNQPLVIFFEHRISTEISKQFSTPKKLKCSREKS